jgi:hypothetical protein
MMIDVMILKPRIIPTNVQSAALLSASSVTIPVYSVSVNRASSNLANSARRNPDDTLTMYHGEHVLP